VVMIVQLEVRHPPRGFPSLTKDPSFVRSLFIIIAIFSFSSFDVIGEDLALLSPGFAIVFASGFLGCDPFFRLR